MVELLQNLLHTLLSPRVVWIVLWTGLAALTVALLVLTRTRWGQARPLTKCIVLSLFAHVLLGGYAYMTNLFYDYPAAPPGESIRISLAEPGPATAENPDRPAQPQPWERFPTAAVTPPVAPELAPRMVDEPDLQPERAPVGQLPTLTDAPPAEPLIDEPAPFSPVESPRIRAERPSSSALDVAEIAVPETKHQPPDDPLQPSQPGLARVEAPQPTEADAPSQPAPELPEELADASSRLQRLADLPLADVDASARSGADQLAQAANRTPNDWQSIDPLRRDRRRTDSSTGGAARARDGAGEQDRPPQSPVPAAANVLPVTTSRRLVDGKPLPEILQFRVADDRLRAAQRHGGNAQTEAAVEAALAWLVANQEDDGRWSPRRFQAGNETREAGHDRGGAGAGADTGISALALLALMGAGHTHLDGEYRKNVQHGLEFLLRSQAADGSLAGPARTFAMMYCHGMATLALSEAYAMTGDGRILPALQRAVDYTVGAQHPTTGGWRYQPGDLGDTSQFGWQVMALKSAELAGLDVPARTQMGMVRFLQSVSSGSYGGRAAYRPGEQTSPTMTAEAMVCRLFLEAEDGPATLNEAARFIVQQPPGQGRDNLYFWYYGTVALHQLHDEHWESWNRALQKHLLAGQRYDAALAGSWDPTTVWGGYGGRVYSTAMATLCLEVYYRYLPLYRPSGDAPADAVAGP